VAVVSDRMVPVEKTEGSLQIDIAACRRTFLERQRRELARREERRNAALAAMRAAIAKCSPLWIRPSSSIMRSVASAAFEK